MSPLLLILATPWTWHAEAGGQVDSDPHGVVNAGVGNGAFSVELITDTLEIWWRPSHSSGRAFIGLRAQGYASGMFVSPWTRGAPDPSRGMVVLHGALHAGWVEYLGRGFYAGLRASTRGYIFRARSEETTVEVPSPTFVLTPEGFAGWWTKDAHLEIAGGGDVREGFVSGRLRLDAAVHLDGLLSPMAELRAGVGHGLDDLTKTRIGGLNPYVVPLAGAAWAEWWVEDYAAVRAGPRLQWSWGEAAAFVDAAVFDDEKEERFAEPYAVGFGLLGGVRFFGMFLDASIGYAPWIERRQGHLGLSAWVLVGTKTRAF